MRVPARQPLGNLGTGLLWIAPWAIGFVVFLAVPVLLALRTSFTDYGLIERPLYVGTENYEELLGDGLFWIALRNTAVYAVAAVSLNLIVSLGIALLLELPLRGRELVRTLVFAPTLVPIVAAAVGWLWLYQPETGLLNRMLAAIGIHGPDWLGDANWALASLVIMGAWVVFTAALRDVPTELHEAAALDGASAARRFWSVTLPSISPALLFNGVTSVIWALQVFATPLVMTRGGPEQSTQVISLYIYQNIFQYGRMGYASALAWLQVLVVIAATYGALKLSNRFVHYRGA
jgi:multiple sugar transport system permease protein